MSFWNDVAFVHAFPQSEYKFTRKDVNPVYIHFKQEMMLILCE